jgi:8-oxo-dGTP diphosphatase
VSDAVAIDVAVGVLIRDDGSFLLAQRPPGKPMAGYWEFPGGKLEAGESVFAALVREFDEELGLHIVAAHPWVQRVVAYPHATVRLHFWRSFGEGRGWTGSPRSNEAQDFRWERIDRLTAEPWLEGALPVKRWLLLPPVYAISHATSMGVPAFLEALDRRLAAADIYQLQLREPGMDDAAFDALFEAVRSRCEAHAVRLLIHSAHPPRYWSRASGVHLSAPALMALAARPQVDWCLASCHTREELAYAGKLGLDAAVLGPVAATASHPGAPGIGWERFSTLAAQSSIPVYAIGGMDADDRTVARGAGAHGIAVIRAAWRR